MQTTINEHDFCSLFNNNWLSIDSHTAGESTRVILGYPAVPGETINAKRQYLIDHADSLRQLLTREPRGSREVIGVLITEPVTPGAACGLIYMDARRYPYLCGHGTIGAVTTLLETGFLQASGEVTNLRLDTPSGPVDATAYMEGRKVTSVAIRMVPSFVYRTDQMLDVPGLGKLRTDLVCTGGFFVMVDKDEAGGINLTPENAPALIRAGMDIIAAANEQFQVQHPTQPHVTTIDVAEFYDSSGHSSRRGRNAVIYGESHIDRSPCGTGTCAKLALLHHHGALQPGEDFTNEGILGTTFGAKIVEVVKVGPYPATVVEIRGSAHLTGYHRFVLDDSDPFPNGFLI